MESKEHNDRLFNERAERLSQYREKVQELEAENADLRAKLADTGWQRIETVRRDVHSVIVGKWHRGQWKQKETHFIDLAIEDGYNYWFEIPAPPKEAEHGE